MFTSMHKSLWPLLFVQEGTIIHRTKLLCAFEAQLAGRGQRGNRTAKKPANVAYCSTEWRRGDACFTIEIKGKHLADEVVTRKETIRFYEQEYPIDASLIQGRKKVAVTFRANKASSVAGVYGLRMIRGDAER